MKFRQTLFWDTDPDKIDTEKNARYIIERVLDLGRDEEVKWVWGFYDKSLIKDVVATSRSLRAESKNLWEKVLA